MEDREKSGAEPLDKSEKEALRSISEQIRKAAAENDWETVSLLRKELTTAANLDIISPKDAIDAALPPSRIKVEENR